MLSLGHLRSLETAGLIRLAATQPDLEYTFRHALLQEAAYHTLSKFARASTHRAVADSLEALFAAGPARETHLGDLAYHYAEAGQWDKTLDYAWQAGAREQAMYAPREALAYFDHALAAAGRLRAPAPGALLRARGQVLETLGRLDDARADFMQALAQARASGDTGAEWQSLLDLGFLWAASDYRQAGTCFHAALDLARAMDDPASLGHSLNRLGNWHLNIEEPEVARQYHAEALAIFERLGDRHSTAQTLDLLGITSALENDFAASSRYYPRAIALFRELGDRPGLLSAQTVYLLRGLTYQTEMLAVEDLSPDEVRQVVDECLPLARSIGHRAAETFLLGIMAITYGPRGAYAQAHAYALEALRIAEEMQHRQWNAAAHFCLGAFYIDMLALPLARQHAEAALALARQANTHIWIHNASGSLAHACAAQYLAEAWAGEAPLPQWHSRPTSEWPEPLALARKVLEASPQSGAAPRTSNEAVIWYGRGHLALATGDLAGVLTVTDTLEAFSSRNRPNRAVIPAVARLRAEALTTLGRPAEALAVLAPAVARAGEQGAVSTLWRLHNTQARAHAALGQSAQAQAARAAARAQVEALGPNVPAGPLRDNFLRQALASAAAEEGGVRAVPGHPPTPSAAGSGSFE